MRFFNLNRWISVIFVLFLLVQGTAVIQAAHESKKKYPHFQYNKRIGSGSTIGDNPDNWHADVPVYTGVSWADISAIEWQVEGGVSAAPQQRSGLTLMNNGRLQIETAIGTVELPLLIVDDSKSSIRPKPNLDGSRVLHPFMTIEQSRQAASDTPYRTYLGGGGDDIGLDIAVDNSGAAYVVGITWSAAFHPDVTNTLQGGSDIFVAKLNPAGDSYIYVTYLGGTDHECNTSFGECVAAISIADNGDTYLTGATWSTDFPTPNGLYTELGGTTDAFVAKLNASGDQLLYATYLGGSQPSWAATDYGRDIAVDSSGFIYVTGETWATDFPVQNSVKISPTQDSDAFVTKLTPSGSALVYSTYLGGDVGVNAPQGAYDYGAGIAVDESGAAYITGWTASEDLLTNIPASMQTGLGGNSGPNHCREEYWCPDAFVIKLDTVGTPVYGTYLGTPGWDEGRGMAVRNGEAHVTGIVGDCEYLNDCNAFITKLNANGDNIMYTTTIGGSQNDRGNSIAVGQNGDAYVTGSTASSGLSWAGDPFQPNAAGYADAFIVRLNAGGTQLYGTYMGGSGYDYGHGIAVNSSGVYVTGETRSANFPTSALALQPNHGGGSKDGFAVMLDIVPAVSAPLTLEVIDADGNDVTSLSLNTEGWPISNTVYSNTVANPLTIKATLTNLGETATTLPFVLDITSPDDTARFHTFDFTSSPADNAELCWDIPHDEYSDNSFTTNCVDPTLVLQPSESQTYQWQVWVQPSEAALMQIQGTILVDGNENIVETRQVGIPQAAIHPVVFVHGILGSIPPRNSVITQYPQNFNSGVSTTEGYLDPFLDSYNPLIENLMKTGYELNKTFFPITYDWRQSNRTSATFLGEVLLVTVPVFSNGVPYVVQDNKADVVVHSMGGMVLRAYLEDLASESYARPINNNEETHVNKAVFIASPHRGFPITYRTWEGMTWEEYLSKEVDPVSDGLPVGVVNYITTTLGITTSLPPILTTPQVPLRWWMDNLLWPYFILKQQQPTSIEPCTVGNASSNPELLVGAVGCRFLAPEALYAFTHDYNGIGSLPEMLPEASVPTPYLQDTAGNDYPWCNVDASNSPVYCSPNGRLSNPLLLELNSTANINKLITRLGDAENADNIYVLYNNDQETPYVYTHVMPPSRTPGYSVDFLDNFWYVRSVVQWPNGQPSLTIINGAGDNLIPEYSTRLHFEGDGILPLLVPNNQELLIENTGHKRIVLEDQTQHVVGAILTGIRTPYDAASSGSGLPITAYQPPSYLLNNGDAVAIVILVWSPVDVMITDPLGRSIGYDPVTGQIINEIPDAFYSGNGTDEEFIIIPGGADGNYTVTATGTDSGNFAVSVHASDAFGTQDLDIISGTINTGEVVTNTVAWMPETDVFFADDMESGDANWLVEGEWMLTTSDAHTPITAWAGETITPSGMLTLTLQPEFDLSTARQARLTYWYSQTMAAETGGVLEFSLDGGQSWTAVAAHVGSTDEWSQRSVNLTAYTEPGTPPLQLRFCFFPTDLTDKWLLDDVVIEALLTPTLFELPFNDNVEGWRKWTASGGWERSDDVSYSPNLSWQSNTPESTLTLAGTLDLRQTISPTLTFWHMMDIGGEGIVEISTDDGGTWQPASSITATTNWTDAQINLNTWAGMTVTVRLRHIGQPNTFWTVDDLTVQEFIPPIVHSLPFVDDMEEPEVNWRAVNAWQPVTTTASSPTTSWQGTSADSGLILADQLDLTTAVSPILTFQQRFMLPAGSVGQVMILPENGMTWRPALTITVPVSSWTAISLDLSEYAGQKIGLSFYLNEVVSGTVGMQNGYDNKLVSKSTPVGKTANSSLLLLPLLTMPALFMITRRRKDTPRHWIWLGLTAAASVSLGCGLFATVPANPYPGENQLDDVVGQVEPVILANRQPVFASYVSPDGKWMMATLGKNKEAKVILINLEHNEEYLIDLPWDSVRATGIWVDENHYAFRQGLMLRISDMETWPLEHISYTPGDLEASSQTILDNLAAAADHIYVAPNFGGWTILLTNDPEMPYLVDTIWSFDETVERVIETNVPYTILQNSYVDSNQRYYSPDGRYYAAVRTVPEFEDTLMAVFDAVTDEEVVHAFKSGWYSQFRGWAHDSSGAYFVYKPRGGGADLLHPRNPVYKLMMPGFTPRGTPVLMYPTVTPNTSSEQVPEGGTYVFGNLFRKHSLYRLAMQTSVEAGWYIDDVLVEDAGSTPQINIGSYTVFGLNSVWLRIGSDLYSGDVGALDASDGAVLNRDSEVTIGVKVVFHDPASTIMGDSVTLKRKAAVNDLFYNDLDAANSAVYGDTSTPLTMPLPVTLPPFPAITPGETDYIIDRNDSLELPAGAYGAVSMKKNSVLILTGGVYHFDSIDLGRKSQLLVTATTEIRIANRLLPGRSATISPAANSGLGAADLLIFVGGVNGDGGALDESPKTAVIGQNNILAATIYAPNGTLHIKQNTTATGAFIGRDVYISKGVQLWLESAFDE